MKKVLVLIFAVATFAVGYAQPKAGYYKTTLDGKNAQELKLALKEIVYPHTLVEYNDLWNVFPVTDSAPVDSIPSNYDGGKTDLVYDMYAWMSQFPKFYSDNIHTQTGGFNREHCIPNSWWGGREGNSEAYSDINNLFPADGAANNAKSDWALGEYKSGMTLSWPTADKSNTNGIEYMWKDEHNHSEDVHCYNNASHVWTVGNSAAYGGSPKVFEPADEYKGDIARTYFYLVCAYEGELTWQTNYMFESDEQKHTTILPWAKELLLKWHRQDPVSDKERNRNNAVESLQKNRNPFIDYPELVEYIWGKKSAEAFSLADAVSSYSEEYGNGSTTEPDSEKTKASLMLVFKAKVGQPFNGLAFTNDLKAPATYSSSNEEVATVDQNGNVTIKGKGETVITYSIAETETMNAAQESYKIKVEE